MENLGDSWSNTENGRRAEYTINTTDPFEVSCWIVLFSEAQERPIAEAKIIYSKAMVYFPTCSKFLKVYISREISSNEIEQAQELFDKYLILLKNVELFEMYIDFLKETKKDLSNFAEILNEAYELAIGSVGVDYYATNLWISYLKFLKGIECYGEYAETCKIQKMRSIFQEALLIPMINIDSIWKEYNNFELLYNPQSCEKVLGEKIKDFTNTKKLSKDFESVLKGLIISIPLPPKNSSSEERQKRIWREWINWERNNPIGLEDNALLGKRILHVSEQYLINYCFHAYAWVETLQYLQSFCYNMINMGENLIGSLFLERIKNLYLSGISENKPMNQNLLVNFSYIDFEIYCKNYQLATDTFEKLLNIPSINLSPVYINYMKFLKNIRGIEDSRKVFKRARKDPNCDYSVFVTAALLEHNENPQSLTILKIFDIGLKRFFNDFNFINHYFHHLLQLSKRMDIRSLFEKILSKLVESNSDENLLIIVLLNMHRYESLCGNNESCNMVEKRIYELIPKNVVNSEVVLRIMFNKFSFDDKFYLTTGIDKDESVSKTLDKINNGCFINLSQFQSYNYFSTPHKMSKIQFIEDKAGFLIPDFDQMRPFKPYVADVDMEKKLMPVAIDGVFCPPKTIDELIQLLGVENENNKIYVDMEMLLEYVDNFNPDQVINERVLARDGNSVSWMGLEMWT